MVLSWRFLDTFALPHAPADALAKAEAGVVRVPRGDDGQPDYRALRPGQRAWVVIDHPDSPLRGRPVLVERTASGFVIVRDPHSPPGRHLPEQARERFGHALHAAAEEQRREEAEAAQKRTEAEGLFAGLLPPEGERPLAVGAYPEHDIPHHMKPEQ